MGLWDWFAVKKKEPKKKKLSAFERFEEGIKRIKYSEKFIDIDGQRQENISFEINKRFKKFASSFNEEDKKEIMERYQKKFNANPNNKKLQERFEIAMAFFFAISP